MRRLLVLAALLAAILVPTARAFAADEGLWSFKSDKGACSITYTLTRAGAPDWDRLYGFIWFTDGDFVFVLADDRLEGLRSAPVRITSASGSNFSGEAPAYLDEGETEATKGTSYILQVDGRTDLEAALFGDLTFTYRDRNGRTVSTTVPFGLAAPAVDRCTNTAARLAAAASEEDPEAAEEDAEDEDPTLIGTGSGVAIDDLGHVLTNHHVAARCDRIVSPGLGRARKVALDEDLDLAVLKFDKAPAGMVAFRREPLQLGETVVVAGYPLSTFVKTGLNVTVGNVSALAGVGGDARFIQFTAPATFGNSGGPVLDQSGRLVGLVMSVMDASVAQNMNYGVSVRAIRDYLENLGLESSAAQDRRLSTTEIADQARGHTLLLECRK